MEKIIQVRILEGRAPSFPIIEILTTIAETKIDTDKIIDYMDPNKTPPQRLRLVMERMLNSMPWKITQELGQSRAATLFPESMRVEGEVIAIGVATKRIVEKSGGGQGTHPFSGRGWDLSPEEVRLYAEGVKAQIEKAREFLTPGNVVLPRLPSNKEELTHLIGALCYLKVEEALLSKAK